VEEVLNSLTENGLSTESFKGMNYASIYNAVRKNEEEWGFPTNHLVSLIDRIYDIYDLDAASRWQPAPGLLDTINQLTGYQLALVSNIGKKGLAEALPKFGIQKSFGFMITRNDVQMLKPAQEGLLKAIDWAGAQKENIIHIGDSLSDLYAARNANIKIGIVLGGENKPDTLLQEKPDLILEQLADLPVKLKAIGF
jgi:HAD superfamily hydrolase (TIGR01549 family)